MHKSIFTQLILAAILLCLFSFTLAEDYTLGKCFQLAVSRSETLADQEEQVIQAEEHFKQAQSSNLPNISGLFSYTKQDQGTDLTNIKLTASQPLFHGFRIINAIKQNEKLLKTKQEAYQWAYLQIYSDVSTAYYLLVYAIKDKQLLEEQQKLYEKRLQELNERLQIGRSRKTEILSFEVSMALLKTTISQIDSQILAAKTYLGFLLGVEATISLSEENSALLPPTKDLAYYKERMALRPDIKAAQSTLAGSAIGIELASSSQWLPAVDLNGNFYVQHAAPNQNVAWDAQILFTLPTFFGYNGQSKTDEATSIKRQAEIALAKLQRKTAQDIEDVYNLLAAEKAQIQSLTKAVELSETNVQTVLADYRYGLSNNLDVLQALNAAIDIKRSLNKLRYAYKTDAAKLASLVVDIPSVGGTK